MSVLDLGTPGAAHALGELATRVAEREPGTVLRVVARDGRVAVVATTPFDVLVRRSVHVADVVPLDVVVEAATLAATASEGDGRTLRLPPALDPMRWTSPLPPWQGWTEEQAVPVRELRAARIAAVAAFREAAEAIPVEQRGRPALERLAAEQWDVEVVPGVSVRMAHAAAAHGFLPSGDDPPEARVRSRGPWRRLDLPGGSVLARSGGLTLRG